MSDPVNSPFPISKGGKFGKAFSLFTYTVSALAGMSVVAFGVPEKDRNGNDHVFSGIKRYLNGKLDDFYDIPHELRVTRAYNSGPLTGNERL